RFMAFDMSRVRIVPDAPTRVPATMSSWLLSVNPAIATASPVYALSSEMTTGKAAPPIGITNATPNARASSVMTAMRSIGSTGAVEERNHLWHRSHLDHAGAHESGDPSHRDAGEDHRDPALHVRREEGCDDRDKHSRRGDAIAQNRGRWRRESLETQDESDGRDEVGDGDQGCDGHWGFRVGRCLNIASIRSVTTNPPTTFAVPSTMARNPRTVPTGPGMALATSIAPTMTMPWM